MGVRFPITGIKDNCELPRGYWELNSGPLSHLSSPRPFNSLGQSVEMTGVSPLRGPGNDTQVSTC